MKFDSKSLIGVNIEQRDDALAILIALSRLSGIGRE